MADWSSLLGGLFGGMVTGDALKSAASDIEAQRPTISDTLYGAGGAPAGGLYDMINNKTTFQPYSVTSNVGSAGVGADGNSFLNLSGGQQAYQDQLLGAGSGAMGRAGADYTQDPRFAQGTQALNAAFGDTAAREQEIYDRIRATQRPEEMRQQDKMQANLFSSGRGGMTSGAYGGSPEEFSYNMARNEAMNQASLSAIGQAQAQQMQDFQMGTGIQGQLQQELSNQAQIGQGLFQTGYLPMQMLMQQSGFGMQNAQLGQESALQGAGLLSQLGLGGLTADVNLTNALAGLYGQIALAGGEAAKGAGSFLGSLIPTTP